MKKMHGCQASDGAAEQSQKDQRFLTYPVSLFYRQTLVPAVSDERCEVHRRQVYQNDLYHNTSREKNRGCFYKVFRIFYARRLVGRMHGKLGQSDICRVQSHFGVGNISQSGTSGYI